MTTNATKVILFLGLFDQKTKAQEISTLDAYKIASNLLCEYIGFGTITEACGVYTHENGEIVQELIAGFCTETEEDHLKTLDIFRKVRYD